MIHMRQPFFSIANAVIYTLLAFMVGATATRGAALDVGTLVIGPSTLWVLSGVMFLMAYFSLVHLKYR